MFLALGQTNLGSDAFLGITVQTWISIVLSSLSFLISLLTFARFWRTKPEPTWILTRFDTTSTDDGSRGIMDALTVRLGHGKAYELTQLTNAGDGGAFEVHAFGHGCIVRMYECEDPTAKDWPPMETTQLERVDSGVTAAWLSIWPLSGKDKPDPDARICIRWTNSPTRLHRCGYERLKILGAAPWWKEMMWFPPYRLARRLSMAVLHLWFHLRPTDARLAPTLGPSDMNDI